MFVAERKNLIGGLALLGALTLAPASFSQDRDRYGDRDRFTRIEAGTNLPVRINSTIDTDRFDNRVYYATVQEDVRGSNGRLAIPRGSRVELMVRTMRDNDLVLDLESVNANGQRYAIQTDREHIDAQRDNSLVGSIVGALSGGDVRGRSVRVPAGSILNFRVQAPLVVGVADRGIDRDGNHYHEWYHRDDYYRDGR